MRGRRGFAGITAGALRTTGELWRRFVRLLHGHGDMVIHRSWARGRMVSIVPAEFFWTAGAVIMLMAALLAAAAE
jgi:hypothetical protein